MVLEIWCDPCTINSRKVLAGLELLDVEYKLNSLDYFAGDHKAESFKKISPSATFPAAVDGDLKIFESNAILQYAADRGGKDKYYPTDLKKRALVNCWLLWEASAWFPTVYNYVVEYGVKQWLQGGEPDSKVISETEPQFHKWATMLENQLNQTKFLVGDHITIADIAVASSIHIHTISNLPWDNYPRLQAWMKDGIEKLPSWVNTQDAVNSAFNIKPTSNGTVNGHHPSEVETTLNYSKDLRPKLTEIYFYDTESAQDHHEPGDDARKVKIYNGWDKAQEFSLDKNGFQLSDFDTSYSKWEDDKSMKQHFYPEVVEFLKKTLGAKRILVFDHTIRTKTNDQKKITQETNTSQRAPVMLVHCDYTAESAPIRVRQLLGDEADDLLSRQVQFINVWKPIHNKVEERPLAMCDVTSAPSDDFFKLYLRYRERNGENYVMRHSDKHKWWYFPEMTPDQVILLKTYDSATDGRARFVGHTAFEDPTTKPDAKTRESVEIRTIAFF